MSLIMGAPAAEDTSTATSHYDPAALEAKYEEERKKRINNGGAYQYHLIEDTLKDWITDPYIEREISRSPVHREYDVVIIGGGYGGQLTAVRLIQQGIKNICIIEKGGDFGGTWYWNRYPGAQCDIESYIYMPLLEELNYVPTEKYAHFEELLSHAKAIGRKFDLYSRALFQTEAIKIRWDDSRSLWEVETNRKDRISCNFVIPVSGPLHRPKLPGVKGIRSFTGCSFHSSRWNYDYTGGNARGDLSKLSDKKVGIIGTGATAIQIVPQLARWAKEVYVFQRTPSSVDIRGNKPTDPEWAKSLSPGWHQARMDNFNTIVSGGHTEEDLVSDQWTYILRTLFTNPAPGADLADVAAKMQAADYKKMEAIRMRVDELVEDPSTAASLKPWYNQFCKRPGFHDEYLQAFNRPNVKLVDTQGAGVSAITPNGIEANGIEYKLDCIVYATGFETSTDWTHKAGLEIFGRKGQTLTAKWREGASTFHGWATRGFPNLFFTSTNTQSALSPNFMHMANEQAKHVAYVITEVRRRGASSVEPTAEAEDAWVREILDKGKLRAEFNAHCTPGYSNNEGNVDLKTQKNAMYGAGPVAFIEILRKWRQDGKLQGLELHS